MSEIEHLRPDGLANNPAYTQVVTSRAARTVQVSGQVAIDADGRLVGGDDLGAQTEQVMDFLEVLYNPAHFQYSMDLTLE